MVGQADLGTLFVRLKTEGVQDVKKELNDTEKSAVKTGKAMEKTSKRFGIGFKAAGLVAAGLFAAVLKGGPVTQALLGDFFQSISFLADTILANIGAWDLLSTITDGFDKLGTFADKHPAVSALAGAMVVAAGATAILATATTGLATSILAALAPFAPLGLAIGAVVGVLILLDQWWKKNNEGVSIFTAALDGAKLMFKDLLVGLTFFVTEGGKALNKLWSKAKKGFNSMAVAIGKVMKRITDNVRTTWDGIKTKIVSTIDAAKSAVVNKLNAMKTALRNTIAFFKNNPVTQAIRKVVTTISSAIPGRASGGAVTGGDPFVVGERGPELFVPPSSGNITNNRDLKTGGFGSQQDLNANITIQMDGRTMWQSQKRFALEDLRRVGF